jgi:hypothetical protein
MPSLISIEAHHKFNGEIIMFEKLFNKAPSEISGGSSATAKQQRKF